jgi:CRP-like cAMP-binding protein
MHQIFLHRDPGHPPQNALLAAMAGCLLQSLEPFLSIVSVPSGTVIYDVGNEIDRVYFPTSGLASLQFIMRDGRVIDTAIIGRNGALGVMAGIARYESKDRCVARSPLTSITISSLDLRRLVHEHRELETMCFIQMDRVLWQTQRSAACYALHTIEMRLANCLLDASEMFSSDTIPFTQDMIAEMLAVRRTSISEAAGQLMERKLSTINGVRLGYWSRQLVEVGAPLRVVRGLASMAQSAGAEKETFAPSGPPGIIAAR